MNRQEFFRRLEYLLRGIPESERMDALAYYNDYFDEAGLENEQQVLQELGSPEQVAQIILDDYYRGQQSTGDYGSPEAEREGTYSQSQTFYGQQAYQQGNSYEQQANKKTLIEKIKGMSTTSKVLFVILLVVTSPVWIGVVAGVFGGLVGLLGGLFGVVVGLGGTGIGLLVSGIACLVIGVPRLLASPVEGVVTIGFGALMTAISILLIVLVTWLLLKWLPTLVKAIVKWVKGLMHSQEGGDEI